MTIPFPSREFDEAVAAVCHGSASDTHAQALNELLRRDPAARDEYLWRVEVHSRLASDPDLFADLTPANPAIPADSDLNPVEPCDGLTREDDVLPLPPPGSPLPRPRRLSWALALAAGVTLLATGWWGWREWGQVDRRGATSKAVAMLSHVVDAEWASGETTPRLGAPLEPGPLRLNAGLAQVVFYSGARVVIEGPAELRLVSPDEATCLHGRLIAEVPPQAKGFHIGTPQLNVTDLGTVFGVDVKQRQTELHVFKGSVEFQATTGTTKQSLREGNGAVADGANAPQIIPANPGRFASLFDLRNKSSAADVLRHEQWRAASNRLDEDPSLLVHFDFEPIDPSAYRLPNASKGPAAAPDATIVGCQWTEGRWPDKRALEFRGVSDRVRLEVPGAFDALTLGVWLRVQGLDRQINSLFMSDAFEAGTVHWSIRQDGVLGLTAIGSEPGRYQICASPPVLTLDQFGLWVHLAAVIDGSGKQVFHYLNGVRISEHALKISPPFRTGMGELGNWNAHGFPKNDPFTIRNFSGAMDEFCLFSRALNDDEIHALYSAGKPQPESTRPNRH